MDPIVLDDHPYSLSLFPFASVRSVADIRIGILTIREKWEKVLGRKVFTTSELGMSSLSPVHHLVPAHLVPSPQWIRDYVSGSLTLEEITDPSFTISLQHPWHIFQHNNQALRNDFELLTKGRVSAPIPGSVRVTNEAAVFIEEGAVMNHCTLNAAAGPIYIGSDTEIMEGASIRGPFALCTGSVVKMGATIYGATTIGPDCTVGGELKNVVMFGYSNKGHDGYLGDAVIGEWCNLGAGTSASNVKNNAGMIRLWDNHAGKFAEAGNKCGLLMGDYSRSAINTSFNTGTITGISANIFGAGLMPTNIPSFSWGSGAAGSYRFENAIQHIGNWKKFKNQELTNTEIQRLKHIFDALSTDNA